MTETRKKYDEEFKKRAVRMCFSSKRTVTQVAESLEISNNMLYAEYNAFCVDFYPDGLSTRTSYYSTNGKFTPTGVALLAYSIPICQPLMTDLFLIAAIKALSMIKFL